MPDKTPIGKILENKIMIIAVQNESIRMFKEENEALYDANAELRVALSEVWNDMEEKDPDNIGEDNKHWQLIRKICHKQHVVGDYFEAGVQHKW